MRDPDLASAVHLDRRWAGELDADTHTFIHASRRRARRRQQLAVGAAIVFGLVAAVAVYAQRQAMVQGARAESATQEAQHRLRALYVEQGRQELLQGRALHAVVYLSEVYQAGEMEPMLRFLLAQAMQSVDAQIVSFNGHADGVSAVAFSPDGSGVWAVAFSPDGIRVVTGSADKTALVWDVHLETRSPAEIAALVQCKVPWRLVAARLLLANQDQTMCPPRSPAP